MSSMKTSQEECDLSTSKLVSTLDRCNVNSRKAVYVTAAVATQLGHNIDDLNIGTSSITGA